MKELDKYDVYKKKLNGVCEKNGLTYSIRNREYPFLLTIKPLGGMDSQQTMLEGMEDSSNTGYISPDASLVFAYKDGALTYKFSETFTLGDELFSKIKNLFKNLHFMWMQHFFRDYMESSCDCDRCDRVSEDTADGSAADPIDEDTDAAFDEFMDAAEDAVDYPDVEDDDEFTATSGLLEDE